MFRVAYPYDNNKVKLSILTSKKNYRLTLCFDSVRVRLIGVRGLRIGKVKWRRDFIDDRRDSILFLVTGTRMPYLYSTILPPLVTTITTPYRVHDDRRTINRTRKRRESDSMLNVRRLRTGSSSITLRSFYYDSHLKTF